MTDTDTGTPPTPEASRRLIYVPFALRVSPIGRRIDRNELPLLNARLKEGIVRRYRAVKGAGSADVVTEVSTLGSYQYAGFFRAVADSSTAYDVLLEQLQPPLFLAGIIEATLHEVFPQGIRPPRIEVGSPTEDLSVGRAHLDILRQMTKEPDPLTMMSDLLQQRPPSGLSLLLSVLLLGLFALAHAWIQYRGARPNESAGATLPPIVNSLESTSPPPREIERVVVVRQLPVAPSDPSAPRIVVVGEDRRR